MGHKVSAPSPRRGMYPLPPKGGVVWEDWGAGISQLPFLPLDLRNGHIRPPRLRRFAALLYWWVVRFSDASSSDPFHWVVTERLSSSWYWWHGSPDRGRQNWCDGFVYL